VLLQVGTKIFYSAMNVCCSELQRKHDRLLKDYECCKTSLLVCCRVICSY